MENDGSNGIIVSIPCFWRGTLIRTPDGETPVETLRRGDPVPTMSGEAKPVTWIGRRTVSARFADPLRCWPVRIRAGALAENVLARDLLVSPDHALLVGRVLIHAGALVNGTSIVRETHVPKTFVYYHVELEDHSLILAEDTPAETFIDNVDRMDFDNWAEFEALIPRARAWRKCPIRAPRGAGRFQWAFERARLSREGNRRSAECRGLRMSKAGFAAALDANLRCRNGKFRAANREQVEPLAFEWAVRTQRALATLAASRAKPSSVPRLARQMRRPCPQQPQRVIQTCRRNRRRTAAPDRRGS